MALREIGIFNIVVGSLFVAVSLAAGATINLLGNVYASSGALFLNAGVVILTLGSVFLIMSAREGLRVE